MDARLRTKVRERAGGRCEYCRIHEDDDPFFTFPIDHVIAQQHGGSTKRSPVRVNQRRPDCSSIPASHKNMAASLRTGGTTLVRSVSREAAGD